MNDGDDDDDDDDDKDDDNDDDDDDDDDDDEDDAHDEAQSTLNVSDFHEKTLDLLTQASILLSAKSKLHSARASLGQVADEHQFHGATTTKQII
eukprot:4724119-Amphidinium_carterae.1